MSQTKILSITKFFLLFSIVSPLKSDSLSSLDEVMSFISSQLLPEIHPRQIKVYSSKIWDYLMIPSVSKFLFEDLDVVENLAPKGQINRPGNVYDKYYICVHDTGDYAYGAKQWSDIVKNAKIGQYDYTSSFQYVIGNDGYYHNIPDNEIAYHAGDGHTEASIFGLIPSGVYTTELINKKPKIEIDEEGYYLINGVKSTIKAPTNDEGEILTTKDINDLGIYSELQQVEGEENKYEYYLGRTWYNPVYSKIGNYGGNLNSIGIESCVNKETDVYYTWQKLAKLVARLMEDNNFTIDAVVQHHYFSGKNCPETMRTAGLWDYFKTIVSSEYQMIQYLNKGYTVEFKSENELVNDKGRIIRPVAEETTLEYTITVKDKEGNSLEKSFSSILYPLET